VGDDAGARRAYPASTGQSQDQAARDVAQREADVGEQGGVEITQSPLPVLVAGGPHLGQHVGMTTDSALTEDNQAAGQNVCAFHGNGDGDSLVATGEIVPRSHADSPPAVDIHRIIEHLAHSLGELILDDGGYDRRLLASMR
jgi:hypothetical protein